MNTVEESVNIPERETYSSYLVGVLAPQVKGNGTRPGSLDGATPFFRWHSSAIPTSNGGMAQLSWLKWAFTSGSLPGVLIGVIC